MSTFKIPNPRRDITCADCGRQATTRREEDLCDECSLYRTHPELAPKYWTWTKSGTSWNATCKWPEGEDFPRPGLRIRIHRKDGSVQERSITEMLYHHYDTSGNLKITCTVV